MFCNMKSRAKEKYDLSKKTGGGPVVSLSPVEEQIVDHLLANNRSQLKGLETGIDSMSSHPEKLVQDLHVHEVPDVCSEVVTVQEVFEGDNLIDSNNNTLSYVPLGEKTQNKPKKTNVSAKRRHEDKEDELYLLEKKKIQAEINQIEQKTEHDKELFLLQKKILEKQINQL
ncbi:uncharacterized protein LOC132756511 isoform X2 [Ruditapes philippinarum]|nr:uncharacterized protein LOC132756511 isoform X2 [Ruditapes philippinarum]